MEREREREERGEREKDDSKAFNQERDVFARDGEKYRQRRERKRE